MSWTYPVAVVVLALALVAYLASVAYAADYSFELTELTSGDELTAASSAPGKPIVVHVWSANCPHCRLHMPYAAALYGRLDPQAAGFVSICVDSTAAEAREYVAERQLQFPVLMEGTGHLGESLVELGWPTTFVFAPDGALVGYCDTQGPQYVAEVLELVERAAQP